MPEQRIIEPEDVRPQRNLRQMAQIAGATALACLSIGGPASNSLAEAAPLPYYEYTPPPGEQQGVALIIHGGGWSGRSAGSHSVTNPYVRAQAALVRKAGFASLNINYRAGRKGIIDVLGFYNMARKIAKNDPVCMVGMSAGGHHALMVDEIAFVKPDCIITEGAPVDLLKLRGPTRQLAVDAFAHNQTGQDAERSLWRWSPARRLGSIDAKLLVGHARNDQLVSADQANTLNQVPGASVQILGPGPEGFTHSSVDRNQLILFRLRELALLRHVAR